MQRERTSDGTGVGCALGPLREQKWIGVCVCDKPGIRAVGASVAHGVPSVVHEVTLRGLEYLKNNKSCFKSFSISYIIQGNIYYQ